MAVKSAVATEFLAAAERFIGNCKMRLGRKHSDEDRKTVECFYRTYVFLRKLGVPNLSPLEVASVFEPFLFTWVDLVKIKASEQVSISNLPLLYKISHLSHCCLGNFTQIN